MQDRLCKTDTMKLIMQAHFGRKNSKRQEGSSFLNIYKFLYNKTLFHHKRIFYVYIGIIGLLCTFVVIIKTQLTTSF